MALEVYIPGHGLVPADEVVPQHQLARDVMLAEAESQWRTVIEARWLRPGRSSTWRRVRAAEDGDA